MNAPDHPVPWSQSGSPSSLVQPEQSGVNRLQLVTLLHVASLVVFLSWDFGGETDFARIAINGWGIGAVAIMALACNHRWRRHTRLPTGLRWLWPLVLFNGLVIASAQNPSFTRGMVSGAEVLMHSGGRPGWPSSAQPLLSLRALEQFDAIFLTCFNLAIVVVQRRLLRWLLYAFTVNSLLLAVMGTFQKLAHASGLYFGAVPSPNTTFFASFIYHNHWGAFIILATAAALGLLLHHARHRQPDGRKHSPALFGLVATLFIAASVPLSASRSCTILLLVLLTSALFYWLRLCRRAAQANRRPLLLPMTLSVAVFAAGLGAIFLLDRPVIEARLDTTRQQMEDLRRRGDLGARQQLYADTWHMARDKPWFGWGLGSYATVFRIYNSQYAVEPWFGQTFYAEAHSDWLQSVAEVGLIGTGLLLLLGILPLVSALRSLPWDDLPRLLFAGCGLIALYAWVEFPFANPAVMLAFWLCFITAVRYHKLTIKR
jgi:O-antigen ligase